MTLQWVDEVMDNGRVYCEADTPHGPATVTEHPRAAVLGRSRSVRIERWIQEALYRSL